MARTNRNRSGSTGRPGRSSGDRKVPDKSVPSRADDEEFVEYDPDEDPAEDLADSADELTDDDTDADADDDDADADADDDDADDEPARPRQGTRVAGQRTSSKRPTRRDKKGTSRSPLGSEIDEPRGSRRARLASLEASHRRAQRFRVAGLVTVCVVLAAAVLAWPTYLYVSDAVLRSTPRNQLGTLAANAGCLPDEKHAASGNQEHVADGTVVPYPRLPPDSGPHYNVWAPFGTTFYDVADRPPVENLVHNLEHGYTILWYDAATITPDELKVLKVLASTYNGTDPRVDKFIAAPWKPGDQPGDDGGAFPAGTRFIFTRWLADKDNPGDASKQFGVRQACAQLSGEALEQFMAKYPQELSPEPNGG